MIITKIEHQKNNPKRFNIFLDGQYRFSVDGEFLVKRQLAVEKEITETELETILEQAEIDALFERVSLLFIRRQRSEKEVRDYLRKLSYIKGKRGKESISEVTIDTVIKKLKDLGWVNDEQFAKLWAESRRRSKLKGSRAIKAELFQKGIDREIINSISEQEPEYNEKELARKALSKKIVFWKSLPCIEFKKKALEYLVRRGFDYSISLDVVNAFQKEE